MKKNFFIFTLVFIIGISFSCIIHEPYENFENKIETFYISELSDSYARFSWNNVLNAQTYQITIKSTDEEISYTKDIEKTKSDPYVEFFHLKNNKIYKVEIFAYDKNKNELCSYCSTELELKLQKEKIKNLFLIYADGDTMLYSPIIHDLNEMEYGLFVRQNENPESENIKIIALWDGYKKVKSFLLELGPDSEYNTEFSQNTKNLSYTAPWINSKNETLSKDCFGEVDMSSTETLSSFLSWAVERYDYENLILIFEDHGEGPGYTTSEKSRAICLDDSSGGNDFLSTKEIGNVLKFCGFLGDKKIAIIIEDLCYGMSIEEAYEFKDYAHYYISSQNQMPAHGLNYMKFISTFSDLKLSGEKIVEDFADENSDFPSDILKNKLNLTGNEENFHQLLNFSNFGNINEISFIDLSKIEKVKDSINDLVVFLQNETSSEYIDYIVKNFIHFSDVENTGKTIACFANYTWLYDLGFIAENIWEFAEVKKLPELKLKAENLAHSVSELIIKSWRSSSIQENEKTVNFYDYLQHPLCEKNYYGISICGETVITEHNLTERESVKFLPGDAPQFYESDFSFGKESKWSYFFSYY